MKYWEGSGYIDNKNLFSREPNKDIIRDSNGKPLHGIFTCHHEENEAKFYICKGALIRKYTYPIITRLFQSPLINDYNLHLCNGWSWPTIKEDECITRVLCGKKPMGFFVTSDKQIYDYWCNGGSDSEIFKFPLLDFGEDKTLINEVSWYKIGVCVPGTFKDHFNLELLAHDYCEYAKNVSVPNSIIYRINKLFKHKLSKNIICNYLTFNYTKPTTYEDLIIIGLILGYPIETTVSIMWMKGQKRFS